MAHRRFGLDAASEVFAADVSQTLRRATLAGGTWLVLAGATLAADGGDGAAGGAEAAGASSVTERTAGFAAADALSAGRVERLDATAPQPDGTAEVGEWAADYETALVTAAATGRPVVVHLYAAWCAPCAKMEKDVLDEAPVLSKLGGTGVVGVRVDVDERQDLAEKYAATALPMDVFLTPEGDVLTTAVGPADAADYAGRLGRVAAHVAAVPAEGETACDACETDDPRELLADLAKGRAADDPAAAGVGLRGYSPVSLVDGRVWVKGSAAFAWYAGGVTYYLGSAEELSKFRADPEKYAPQLSGFDPHLLSTTGRAVPGRSRFGAFYKGKLYLHATDANRRAFMADPAACKLPARVFPPATKLAAKHAAGGEMMGS